MKQELASRGVGIPVLQGWEDVKSDTCAERSAKALARKAKSIEKRNGEIDVETACRRGIVG